ncbi:MAG: protein translocase subunit SecD [Verrucomicrobiaceae bacterium]|nr:protein translocase subunit SecD [Verrucomicrobiaceae bacterium]
MNPPVAFILGLLKMGPKITFVSGAVLLLLFLFYLGTTVHERKRSLGTILTALVVAFFLWAFGSEGIKKGIDLQGGSTFVVQLKPGLTEDGKPREVNKASIDQAVSILEKRLNPDGHLDMLIAPQGADRIEIQMPGVKEEEIASVREKIQQVAHLEFRMAHDNSEAELERIKTSGGVSIGYVEMPMRDPSKGIKSMLVRNRTDLDGKYVKSAHPSYDAEGWKVYLYFNKEGADLFDKIAEGNLHKPLAIIIDGQVISAPVLQTTHFGGTCVISGHFTETEVRTLASVLENPLENPMVILQEGTVSAAFGEATIRQGIYAGMVGLILTAVFMVIYYRVAGMVALIGLAVSMLSVIGAMSLFQFTLTMPGIAGLVLTIAMAVDANVLIYERLREEMRAGKTLRASLDAAHDRAFTAIFDSHVTTLITSAILLMMASGLLKGFAITLVIGIFSTLFGALIVTRVALHWFVDPGIIQKLSVAQIIPHKIYDVMKYGFQFVMFSTILCVIALAAVAIKGKHALGIDYRGGALVHFQLKDEPGKPELSTADIETALKGLTAKNDEGKDVSIGGFYVQKSHSAGGNMITVRAESFAGPAVQAKIESQFGARVSGTNLETVGALIGTELAKKSAWAVVLALGGIFLYLYFRYEYSFALGALVSIVHDCVIVLGFSVIFGQELSLVHIGAILTVAGYSVNDTIIVFDRVREIIRSRSGTITDLMNEAISLTFSRTLLTSLVTFIPMVVLYLFGGPAMKEFSLPIVIGVVVGTYSSIFVAAPIVLWHARRTGHSLHKQVADTDARNLPTPSQT